jgi:hypothetical protein
MMLLITLALSVVACTGPETGDDRDPTPTPTATATPTEVPPTATATLTPTAEPTATTTPTATVGVSPTAASSATAATTATVAQVSLPDRLPTLEDLPNERYAIAEEGTRSAEDLAAAYSDVVAHLRRLDEWGFKQHVFRAFSLTGADDDTLPHLILTTINAYGSAEQAEAALQWLQQYGTATGATESDPPSVGEQAVALTVPTSTGIPTASIYVRQGSLLFVYFAEGGDPLPIVDSIATKVFSR